MEAKRFRGYDLSDALFPTRAQPVERSRGATQHGQRCNAKCGPETHALCATLPGINRSPATLPSYNIFPFAEMMRLALPGGREL